MGRRKKEDLDVETSTLDQDKKEQAKKRLAASKTSFKKYSSIDLQRQHKAIIIDEAEFAAAERKFTKTVVTPEVSTLQDIEDKYPEIAVDVVSGKLLKIRNGLVVIQVDSKIIIYTLK